MALICDPDYLIHSLRLNYLRHIDDPYGPRLISFDPRYSTNSNVLASGAADAERWPELHAPQSPDISDEEGNDGPNGRHAPSGFPGARGLKYTQTIMGPSRAGALGMRVSGRRAMTGNELAPPSVSISDVNANTKRLRADSEPTPAPTVSNSPRVDQTPGSPDTYDDSLIQVSKRRSAGGTSLSEIATTLVEKAELGNGAEPQSTSNGPLVLQSMSRIAAVQARRQRRRAHFSSAGSNTTMPIIVSETTLNPESSSEEEIGGMSGSIPDEDFLEQAAEGDEGVDGDADEFDPVFAPSRLDHALDGLKSVSNSALSTSASSAYNSALQIGTSSRGRSKLSPVNEGHHNELPPATNGTNGHNAEGETSDTTLNSDGGSGTPIDSYFEIVKPPIPESRQSRKPETSRDPSVHGKPHANGKTAPLSTPDELLFTRRKVAPVRVATSALTAKLASSNTSSNPFSELYALISGRAEVASMAVTVYFPHARQPLGRALELNVRKDATVEEVVGFALWSYWEEGWLPKLDEGVGSDEKKREIRLSAAGWVLRIAEDDGEVDEDFPAPDRMGKISKFSFEAYAILEATPAQIAQNEQLEAKLVRRPSRIIVAKKRPEPGGLAPTPSLNLSTSAAFGPALGTSLGLSTSLSISSSHGPPVLLRIRMADMANTAVHYSTTISVSSTMYMQEVLEQVCRKRKLSNPKEWALLSSDSKILVQLDRTVPSLEGSSELVLVLRSLLPAYGFAVDGDRRTGRSIDPNASIFKRISDVQPKSKITDVDFNAYKRYIVYRKVPMLVARLERTLAIDGDYIHIMPSANKARGVFDNGKTVSYNIKSVVSCSQSGKASSSFKIVFRRDGGDKRYDFEAESSKLAAEIVANIRGVRYKPGGLERSATVNKIRRSRQVS